MKLFLNNCWRKTLPLSIKGLLLLLSCLPALSAHAGNVPTIRSGDGVETELWDGKVLTATFRAGMCFDRDGGARGVLLLRHASGQQDVYHLYGALKDNEFYLSHSSGHVFSGKLASPEKMEGNVKLANGLKLSLKGARHKNVALAASDCAPLPE